MIGIPRTTKELGRTIGWDSFSDNIDVLKKYPKIKEFIEYKLLTIKKGNLKLTNKGYYLTNLVYEIFV